MRILLVEDDETLADAVVEALSRQAYAVDHAADGARADELASVNDYDLILLDRSLPSGPGGMELLQQWRSKGLQTPVLILTASSAIEDRVDGLDLGADDYLTKPFSFAELLARVRSLLRRRQKVITVLQAADVELDAASHQVKIRGELTELAPKEFGILQYLLTRVGEPVSRSELAEHVWDDDFDAMSNVIDVLIYRLRKKIDGGRDSKLLQTVKGVGYVLRSQR